MDINRDDAIYFLIFSVAAVYKESTVFDFETVSENEWKYLRNIVEEETLSISEDIQKERTLRSNWLQHKRCIEVLKEERKAIQYRTIYHMFLMACVENERNIVSDTDRELVRDVALSGLGISEEIFVFIFDKVTEGEISDLTKLTSMSGVELLDELTALDGIGQKTAMKVLEVFADSAALTKDSLKELQDIGSASPRHALVIKEKYK